MKLYNTLTRKKEDFTPLNGNTVRMYSCGPTVYNYAHIGNLRTYVFMDLLRRALKYEGYKLKGVMNITDVGHLMADSDDGEDKMAKTAREQNKDPYEIAEFYTYKMRTSFLQSCTISYRTPLRLRQPRSDHSSEARSSPP